MSVEKNPDGKWLYQVGGVSALGIGIAYLAIFPLFARVGGAPTGGGEVWLKYLEGKTTVWWAYVAAANYASAVLASHTEVFYSIVDLSLAILMIGFVMLKGNGIVTIIINAVLTTAWVLFVGHRLFRLGR